MLLKLHRIRRQGGSERDTNAMNQHPCHEEKKGKKQGATLLSESNWSILYCYYDGVPVLFIHAREGPTSPNSALP
jgi:hypothetical protein